MAGGEVGPDAPPTGSALRSVHFSVLRDGAIHQYVEEADTAWHISAVERSRHPIPWLETPGSDVCATVNLSTIGIEHEGHPGEALTPAQFRSTVALHRHLLDRWAIPLDRDHILAHDRLTRRHGAGCPGPGFPWDGLFSALREYQFMDQERIRSALDSVLSVSAALSLLQSPYAEHLKGAVRAIREETGVY